MGHVTEERYHRLARELFKGLKVKDALVAAGWSPTNRKIEYAGRRISPRKHPVVMEELQRLQTAARAASMRTASDIVAQLMADREFARANNAPGPAVTATMGIAKVLGLVIDKKQKVKRVEDMSREELLLALGMLEDDADGAARRH